MARVLPVVIGLACLSLAFGAPSDVIKDFNVATQSAVRADSIQNQVSSKVGCSCMHACVIMELHRISNDLKTVVICTRRSFLYEDSLLSSRCTLWCI